jgi:hypothetical protein
MNRNFKYAMLLGLLAAGAASASEKKSLRTRAQETAVTVGNYSIFLPLTVLAKYMPENKVLRALIVAAWVSGSGYALFKLVQYIKAKVEEYRESKEDMAGMEELMRMIEAFQAAEEAEQKAQQTQQLPKN